MTSRHGHLGVLVGLAVVASCATTGGDGTAGEPPAQGFGGRYTLAATGSDPSTPPEPIIVDLDDEFGSLRIDTGCGTLLGAYSLLPDGRAGVTVAGGSATDCPPELGRRQSELLADLAAVDAWAGDGVELRLETDDTTLVLRR